MFSNRNPLLIIIFFFLVLFLYTKIVGSIPLNISSVSTVKTDSFSTSGEGIVYIKPDMANINIGVSVPNRSAKNAQEELNTKINSVIASLKKVGIPEEDIQTGNYSMYPTTEPVTVSSTGPIEQQRIGDFMAESTLTVKVKDLSKLDQAIDESIKSGANLVSGIYFDLQDKTKATNEARDKAVKIARENAELAAKSAGFKLGKVVNYSESNNIPYIMPHQKSYDLTNQEDSPTQTQPGNLEIKINVTLSFEVK